MAAIPPYSIRWGRAWSRWREDLKKLLNPKAHLLAFPKSWDMALQSWIFQLPAAADPPPLDRPPLLRPWSTEVAPSLFGKTTWRRSRIQKGVSQFFLGLKIWLVKVQQQRSKNGQSRKLEIDLFSPKTHLKLTHTHSPPFTEDSSDQGPASSIHY